MRPGEKLYEELQLMEEDTVATGHEKIRVFAGKNPSKEEMTGVLRELAAVCETRDLGGWC